MESDSGLVAGEGPTDASSPHQPPLPPINTPDGQPNPDYYAERYRRVNLANEESMRSTGQMIRGYDSALRAILQEAKWRGLTERQVLDRRSEGDKALDAAAALIEKPSSIWELTDEEIVAVEKAMDKAELLCREYIEKRLSDAREGGAANA